MLVYVGLCWYVSAEVMEVFQPTLPPSSYNVYKGFEDSSEVLAAKEAGHMPWYSKSTGLEC